MANKRIVLQKWNWWISNDPNVWQPGSFAYGEWIEIRTDSKKFTMSLNTWNESMLTSNINNYPTSLQVSSTSNYLIFHKNWEISNINKNYIDSWNYVTKLSNYLYNSWVIQTNNWTKWFIIAGNTLYKWTYDSNDSALWLYISNSSWLWTNMNFSSWWTWWTYTWSDWTFTWWDAKHTIWNTTTLSQTLSPNSWDSYRIEARAYSITAWSCIVKMWWQTIWTLTSTNNTVIWIRTTTSASEMLEFTPTSDFNWYIQDVAVQTYTLTSQTASFSNESAPILIGQNTFYVWNWSKLVKVDTSLSNWVISDALIIDLDYTIKWITRIWDQILIYASNWSAWKQYLWDWASTTSQRQITWVDKPIQNVANFANTDYVITWWGSAWKTQFWRVDGYQLTLINQNNVNNNPYNERIYFSAKNTNAIETIGTKLLIPWLWWIYTYGQFSPWMSDSLVKEYTNNWVLWWNTNSNYWNITALYYSEWSDASLWIVWQWNVWWIDWVYMRRQYVFWNYFSTTEPWYLQTNPIFWDCLSNKKNTRRFTLWVKWTNGKNFINVYSKNDDIKWFAEIIIPRWIWLIPTEWSIYSISGNNYTITNVLNAGWIIILQTTCPTNIIVAWWIMTKVSWTWETTYYTDKIRYDYKYLTTISDFTSKRFIYNYPENFNEMSFAFELITNDTNYTPAIYDFNLYYDETDDG
jgi:hypothetical protein